MKNIEMENMEIQRLDFVFKSFHANLSNMRDMKSKGEKIPKGMMNFLSQLGSKILTKPIEAIEHRIKETMIITPSIEYYFEEELC